MKNKKRQIKTIQRAFFKHQVKIILMFDNIKY